MAQSEAGMLEYQRACASCHGIAAQGNGPLAEFMTVPVPDLTQISLNNDGEFPMLQVIQIIDGRTGVRGHGYPMPVWGDRFSTELAPEIGEYGAELIVRGRILALATHLESIQEE
ncbi:cytochrome c [Maritalea mobilis]|uniref:c-type cytochrome n=1 Tax=Maritalea mobilis TaxID=483324 RepID=UPI001C9614BA|nr:cytochrome c [Maritalea mobilis]MBY6203075.1 cytochrome c [Maritalea mobilis]